MLYRLYTDLLMDIDDFKEEIENAEQIRNKLMQQLEIRKPKEISGQVYSDMPKGSRNDTDMDKMLIRIDTYSKRIEGYTEELNKLLDRKNKLDESFKKREGLYYKVYDLNRIQKIPLEEVADMVGYSHDYIKKISAEISKNAV